MKAKEKLRWEKDWLEAERQDAATGVVRTASERFADALAKRQKRARRLRIVYGIIGVTLACALLIGGPSWVVVHFLRKWW